MPHTLALLRDGGTTFKQGLVTTPICCPSRTALLSGLYGHNLGEQQLQDWCGNFTGHAIENATWITRLHEHGYRTSMRRAGGHARARDGRRPGARARERARCARAHTPDPAHARYSRARARGEQSARACCARVRVCLRAACTR
jgi:arylsulfatase A-like enzyme